LAVAFKSHGDVINGTVWKRSQLGPVLKFDGVNDYVDVNVKGGGTTNTATITAWIKANSLDEFKGIIINDSERKGCLTSSVANFPVTYLWEATADEFDAATGLVLTIGQWHFYALVITPTKATVYLDDKTFTNTKTHNAKNLDVNWRIGQDENDPIARSLNGEIAEVRIYNRSLSPEEIHELLYDPWGIYKRSAIYEKGLLGANALMPPMGAGFSTLDEASIMRKRGWLSIGTVR